MFSKTVQNLLTPKGEKSRVIEKSRHHLAIHMFIIFYGYFIFTSSFFSFWKKKSHIKTFFIIESN